MSDYCPFDRPSRALQSQYSFTDIYFDNCSMLDDADYWTCLKIKIHWGDGIISHKFTRSTSHLICKRHFHTSEDYCKFACQKAWYAELYNRLSRFGLDDARNFRRAFHSLNCNRNNFINSLSVSLNRFDHKWTVVKRATVVPFRM